ncbi:MAG: hypothetical protein PSV22_01380 [Pseudolabrys sp.]|nr:hypothetical protein [Pseudolabrys sp.]
MTMRWLVLAGIGIAGLGIAGLGLIAADPASARPRHKTKPVCVDQPTQFSWNKLFFGGPPQPNGCAPAVYDGGQYIGQDPDINIRSQLLRVPDTGYTYGSR